MTMSIREFLKTKCFWFLISFLSLLIVIGNNQSDFQKTVNAGYNFQREILQVVPGYHDFKNVECNKVKGPLTGIYVCTLKANDNVGKMVNFTSSCTDYRFTFGLTCGWISLISEKTQVN